MAYDASGVRAYFDDYAEREWTRLDETVQGRSSYAIHRRLLERYARPGMQVLDIGAGPGRYAIDLLRLGCAVTVADLSPVQLELARRQAKRGRPRPAFYFAVACALLGMAAVLWQRAR